MMRMGSIVLRAAVAMLAAGSIGGCVTLPGKARQIVRSRDAVPAVVATEQGRVQGLSAPAGTAYLGIPYAAPPVGPLRFAPPQPAAAWTGVRAATRLGSACPQWLVRSRSEDCLNLNVFTPRDATAASRLPVMVWLYGGALNSGSNGQYDGSRLAERQRVIVVVPNYRLGALGFMAHPALRGPGEGDYGLLDQQAALRWVQRNVAAFGGDPSRVTLFGESAGAASACTHMVAPGSRGLFHRVILESDTCIFPDQWSIQADAERGGVAMAADLGCTGPDTLACLRALPAKKLLKAKSRHWGNGGKNSWSPMIGGDVLPRSQRDLFASGAAAPVPLLMGSNHDEGRLFANVLSLGLTWTSRKGYEKAVARAIRPDVRDVAMAEYADVAKRSYYRAFADMVTDSHFACPMLTLHRLRGDAASTAAPTYAYEFDDPDAPRLLPDVPFAPRQHAYHASELGYVFQQHLMFADPARWTPAQRALSDRMQAYWGAFATTGDPNRDGADRWPRFDGTRPFALSPVRSGVVDDFAARHHCSFWKAHGS